MQREIKFRVWDEKYNGWEKSFLVYVHDIKHQGRIFQQYTGLKDKNGKEIYEGDIVKYKWSKHDDDVEENIGEVYFEDGIFYFDREMQFATNDGNFIESSLEVMGNIFENQNLIK